MKYLVLFGTLICLSQIPASAQDTISTSNQSMEGTWISQLTDSTGTLSLFEFGQFSPDGSYAGANVNPLHSTHKGVWLRAGDRKFLLTVLFFTHDDKGVFNGIGKAWAYLTLAEDGKSYDSVAERVVMDTASNVLQVVPNIMGHAIRMNIEVPGTPAP